MNPDLPSGAKSGSSGDGDGINFPGDGDSDSPGIPTEHPPGNGMGGASCTTAGGAGGAGEDSGEVAARCEVRR
jgi:hypothetical protein